MVKKCYQLLSSLQGLSVFFCVTDIIKIVKSQLWLTHFRWKRFHSCFQECEKPRHYISFLIFGMEAYLRMKNSILIIESSSILIWSQSYILIWQIKTFFFILYNSFSLCFEPTPAISQWQSEAINTAVEDNVFFSPFQWANYMINNSITFPDSVNFWHSYG